ncbi:MAG: AMP-binding protein [Rhodobacter sp.]|nr:AMP-binding protein [Rhodobacter sp.]
MFAQAIARSAQVYGSAIAVQSRGRSWTYAEFTERVARTAGGLAGAGVQPGDRVAVLAANSPEHLLAMYAILWMGAVLLPINTRLSVEEMQVIAAEAEAVALFSDAANRASAERLLSARGMTSIALEDGAVGTLSLQALALAPAIDTATCAASDLAAIYYTGGTTGGPKGVMTASGAFLDQGLVLKQELAIEPGTVFLHAPPLFHLAGTGIAHGCTVGGATQVFLPEFAPHSFLDDVAQIKATHLSLVPTMIADLVERPGFQAAMAAVKRIVYGTSPITEDLLRRVMDKAPGVEFTQIYGQTECAGSCLFLPPERHVLSGPNAGKLASAGRASAISEVRIHAPDDRVLPVGEAGEIVLRATAVMLGYWKKPEVTAEAMRGGWLHTGDVGIMDADGFVRIVDRLKDMIVTGGENVFCAEVENVIADHPAVGYCAVVGLPDPRWGERVHAVIGLRAGHTLTLEQVVAHCRPHIAGYKCPKSLEITTEPLPLSSVGKVRKDVLRARAKAAEGTCR